MILYEDPKQQAQKSDRDDPEWLNGVVERSRRIIDSVISRRWMYYVNGRIPRFLR